MWKQMLFCSVTDKQFKEIVRKFLALGLVVCIVFCSINTNCNAKSKLHAYTLNRAKILNGNGKKVASLEKGIVFQYLKIVGKYVQISYYGKKRYLKTSDLVLNSQIESFVRTHPTLFAHKISTLSKTVVYKDSNCSKVLYRASAGEEFKIYWSTGNLYKVQVDGNFGYLRSKYVKKVCYVDVVTFPKIRGRSLGQKIANFAKNFVGGPYVWGGTSLTSGCDCSGFVQSVYKQFGYDLPRCSYQQADVGKRVSLQNLKPGDLIFYYRGSKIGHVTLYIGGGKVVQARGKAYGIVITNYDYNVPAWARRII